MTITTKLRTGKGLNLHEQGIWPRSAENLRQLLACCSDKFKEQFWNCFDEDVFAENWDTAIILENFNADNPLMGLATIMQEAIRHREGIQLTAAIDFSDSDQVILALPDGTPGVPHDALEYAFKLYTQILTCVRYNPVYVSWHEEVAPVQEFFVDTPIGKLKVCAKPENMNSDYPGIYIDFVSSDGEEVASVCCVEYSPADNTIATDVYVNKANVERFYLEELPGVELATAKNLISTFLKNEYKGDAVEDFKDLSKIGIAWGSPCEDEKVDIQVYVDLKSFCIRNYLKAKGYTEVLVSTMQYASLEDLISDELEFLHYDSLVEVTDAEWRNFSMDVNTQKWLLQEYPVGSVHTFEGYTLDYTGTVTGLTPEGYLIVEQNNGTTVHLLYCGFQFSEEASHGKG